MVSNFDVARAYWDTEITRDLDAIMDFYHEDATFVAPGWNLHGRDAIRVFYADAGELYPGLEVEIVHEITSGTESAFEWQSVLITPVGLRLPLRGINCLSIIDGKFAAVRSFYDTAELSPQ